MKGLRTFTDGRVHRKASYGNIVMAILLYWFVLSPFAAVGEGSAWRFVFFSDTQDPAWGPSMHTNMIEELAVAIADEHPAFVLFGGDMANYWGSVTARVWMAAFNPVYAAGIPVYPALGNHDLDGFASFCETFGPWPIGTNDPTYTVTHSNVLVLVLNAFYPNPAYTVNVPWLEAVLTTNKLSHVFAVSHPPAFKLQHFDCLGQNPGPRDVFWNLLTQAGCRAYFCGHDHFYDHTRIDDGDGNPDNDIHQFIAGTGGSGFYPDSFYNGENGRWQPVRILHEQNYGYLLIDVEGAKATITWKRRAAPGVYEAADSFSYVAGNASLRLRASLLPPGSLTLDWSGEAVLESSETIAGPFRPVSNARSPYVISNPSQVQGFFRLTAVQQNRSLR